MLRRALTNALLFYPERGQWRTPAALDLSFGEIWITAPDRVRTQAWWIPAADPACVLVFFHGNAGTMADRLDNARLLHDLGLSLLMVEYRGYGDSAGRPDERGIYADAAGALAAARSRAEGLPIIAFGRSLGGAVAVEVAARGLADGLAIESTFTSLRAMARVTRLPLAARLVAYDFDSQAKIGRVAVPILLCHGDADELVPFAMARSLRDAATAAPRVIFHAIPGGDHNASWLTGGAAYWSAWRELIAAVVATD